MKFSWDANKAKTNESKHGIRFEDAITAFDDPYALRTDDTKHSTQEARQWLIGETDLPKVVVVIFVERDKGQIYRIISARPANRKERTLYEKSKRIPI